MYNFIADNINSAHFIFAKFINFTVVIMHADGRAYNSNVIKAVLDANHRLKGDILEKLGISRDLASEYKVFTEVQFWTNSSKGEFMIADIVLVKYEGTRVADVILVENKLSQATDYTQRQEAGWNLINKEGKLEVKARKESEIVSDQKRLEEGSLITFDSDKLLKVHDDGKPDGLFHFEKINTENYNK